MEKELQELLNLEFLNEDARTSLQEALVRKVEEAKKQARDEIELTLREEYSRRYAETKAELIDATDKMVTETVGKFLEESSKEKKAIVEEKQKLSKAIREARADYKAKLESHKKMLESFILNTLKKEVSELAEDHRDVAIQKVKLQKKINESQKVYEAKLIQHLTMMNEAVARKLKSELTELSEDHKEIVASKIRLQEAIEESKIVSQEKLKEQAETMKTFVMKQLKEEMTKLRDERKTLHEKQVETVKTLRDHRLSLNETYKARIGKLEGFIVEQVTKELTELEKDRQDLAEARVRIASESKAKLLETQRDLITRASKIFESKIETQLRKEFTEMREDIMEARKNNFGRKLFEQYATEFMVSFYSESKEIKKLNEALASQAAKLNEAQSKVGEQQKFVEAANRKVKLAEEKATRVVEMNRLMAPLDKSKRKVMEGLLESNKTEGLSEAFNRFLPHVINGSSKSSSAPTPATRSVNVLNENKPVMEKKTVIEVTGNKTNKLSESVKADEVNSTDKADILNLRRLAGLVD